MGRFSGEIGFGNTVEVEPGVWNDVVEEKHYFGDVVLNNFTFTGDGVNDDPDQNSSISIVGTAYAIANIRRMRYLRWKGQLWIIDSIEIKSPRLILRLGGVYNGPPTPTPHAA